MRIVLLTADATLGRARDRSIARDNERWARQVVERAAVTRGAHEYFHHHARGPHRSAATVRRTVIEAYEAAATVAGRDGRVVAMMGHGSDAMCDVVPAPHLRVTMDTIRAANTFTGSPSDYGSEAEALLLLRNAIGGRFSELYMATCNMGRGTGPSFLRSLGRVIQGDAGRPMLYGLAGFLWSNEEDGRVVMGVSAVRGQRPMRVHPHADELWGTHWIRQREGGAVP